MQRSFSYILYGSHVRDISSIVSVSITKATRGAMFGDKKEPSLSEQNICGQGRPAYSDFTCFWKVQGDEIKK